jgi:hypothetical protein
MMSRRRISGNAKILPIGDQKDRAMTMTCRSASNSATEDNTAGNSCTNDYRIIIVLIIGVSDHLICEYYVWSIGIV